MAERYFEIKNFRNLGIKKSEKIIINTGLTHQDVGKLVILVGENNAGKSNVLRAILAFAKNNICERDVPDFVATSSPCISFGVKDNARGYLISTTIDQVYTEKEMQRGITAKQFKKEYGYNLVPKIYIYEETKFNNDDLIIRDSRFFNSLMKHINLNDNATIKDDLKHIGEQFNKFFLKGKNEYSFSLSNKGFEIKYLNKKINLDYQSSGFTWFFNFFFSFMLYNKLKVGDILIMDEPATSLHVKGMIELRKYIKDLAASLGVTIIISTNVPFLIDCDYLDELRIVSRRELDSEIINNFTMVNGFDSLDMVLGALTIGRHIVVSPQTKVVFVEGITDYNYLTAFKILFDIKNLLFLPIQGVNHRNLGRELLKLQNNPVLLTDNDAAGNSAKNNAIKYNIKAISLGDIDPLFVAIESLFDYLDLYEFKLNDKSFAISSNFKNNITSFKLTKKTRDNFKKVLMYIKNN